MTPSAMRKEIYLRPGEWCFGSDELLLKTLLGSCVSITLWHPKLRVGGMCHYLLAKRRGDEAGETLSGRYADEALLLLVREALRHGRPLHEFQAKLIGGASVLSEEERELQGVDIPGDNMAMARSLCLLLGIGVLAEDLGGSGARLVLFDIATGDVWVRQHHEYDPQQAARLRGRATI